MKSTASYSTPPWMLECIQISFQNKLDSILFPLSFVIDVFFDDSSVGSTIANSINITTNDYNQRPFLHLTRK